MVLGIHSPDRANALQRGFISDVATQGVAGVGGINDQPAAAHDGGRLLDEPALRIVGVNDEVLSHASGTCWVTAIGRADPSSSRAQKSWAIAIRRHTWVRMLANWPTRLPHGRTHSGL